MNWLNKIRTKVECALDYAWYVGERWGEITNNPKMSGNDLLWGFWLWIVMLPFIMPLLCHYLPWLVAAVVGICLVFSPFLFCHFRYTKQRRKTLDRKYRHMKNIGSRLARLVVLCIVLAIVAFRLSFFLGLLKFAGE